MTLGAKLMNRTMIHDSRSTIDDHKRSSKWLQHLPVTLEVSFTIIIFL